MCELLLMAIGVFLGIMFLIYSVSSAYSFGGVWGILLLIICIIIGCSIASSEDDKKKQEKEEEERLKREETVRRITAEARKNRGLPDAEIETSPEQRGKTIYVFGSPPTNVPDQTAEWIERVTDKDLEKYIRDTLLWISRRPIVPFEHPQTDDEVRANEEAKKKKQFQDKDGLLVELEDCIGAVGKHYDSILNITDAQRILMANRGKLTLKDAREGIRFESNMPQHARGEKYDLALYMTNALREYGVEDALYIGNNDEGYCIADKALCTSWNKTVIYLRWEPMLGDAPYFETNADRLDWLDNK